MSECDVRGWLKESMLGVIIDVDTYHIGGIAIAILYFFDFACFWSMPWFCFYSPLPIDLLIWPIRPAS